jgi:alkanesulfonate monooxygenase SsuD/methylene tetrahydromethanopterin reductase-like flavin-dependent oxidoreductase (luciferase family)
MKFGVNFFPTVGPDEKSASQYYAECLALTELAEDLGYNHVKTVEHYFFPYGGYSPDPVTFLAAAAARTSRIRLVTGAAIPAFTHPVKLAGKLAMLDNISKGRLDVGFGRGFLPGEFSAFGVPMDESRPRFDEGVSACIRLWSGEDVVWDGQFYQFGPVTLLPRPYQQPHPPVYVAAAFTPESCAAAGRNGFGLLLVPSISKRERVQEMLGIYRQAWAEAGHEPGAEQVQMSYSCYVAEDHAHAIRMGRLHAEHYTASLAEATSSWAVTRSNQYQGYERLVDQVKNSDYDAQLADNKVLAGTPDDVLEQVRTIREWFGDISVSLQINSGNTPLADASRSLRLFAEDVIPSLDKVDVVD